MVEGPGLAEVGGFAGEGTHFAVACFKEGGAELDDFIISNLLVEVRSLLTCTQRRILASRGAGQRHESDITWACSDFWRWTRR